MAEALISGLVKGQVVHPSQLFATDVVSERLEILTDRFGIRGGASNQEAAQWASLLVLCVKPQLVHDVLAELQDSIRQDCVLISVVAGLPIAKIAARLQSTIPIIRAMPNTPALVLEGATALAEGPGVTSQQRAFAQQVFEAVGKVVMIPELFMNAVTGLSGGGPAYVYVMIEALADGGVKMGLPRSIAQVLAAQTVLGAAKMVLESEEHPGVLKDRVASPGGTTIAGLHAVEEGRLRATLINAVEEATKRSEAIGAA